MKITANGTSHTVAESTTLSSFLESIGQTPGLVVVERNKLALTPGEAARTVLADGDQLEVVRIVAGG